MVSPTTEPFVLLDNSLDRAGSCYLFENPTGIIRAESVEEAISALPRLAEALSQGRYAAGFFSYEFGYLLEPRLASRLPDERTVPLIWFGLFDNRRTLSPDQALGWIQERCRGERYQLEPPSVAISEADYRARFAAAKRLIGAGDIYQINFTTKAKFQLTGAPLALYLDLRRKQRVKYGAVVQTEDFTVLSSSPELFLSRQGETISTRPMKGTAARGLTPSRDDAIKHWLSSDPKSRAENLMIVDLMRNDLGRISEIGSVRVTDLFTVETYPTLHQMTSGIGAKVGANVDLEQLIRSVFPPGSITGAPKIRAMELISDLEAEPRGVYTGSIGMFGPDGQTLLNVAIRTIAILADGRGEIGIGSGLVADSDATAEYQECLLKMRFLTDPPQPFHLIETILYDPKAGFWLLDRHLERLKCSSAYFGFDCDIDELRAALEAKAPIFGSVRWRVRLMLNETGEFTISAAAMAASDDLDLMEFVVSERRVDSANAFLYHKTTRRQLYDEEYDRVRQDHCCDEVLFLNERGELTEGSRMNVFLKRGSRLLTPALGCGLLPGTLRAELLEIGRAEEAVLAFSDILTADRIYLGNSVRGLVPACLLDKQELDTARSVAAE